MGDHRTEDAGDIRRPAIVTFRERSVKILNVVKIPPTQDNFGVQNDTPTRANAGDAR